MVREQTAAAVHLAHRLDHRPVTLEPVVSRGAAPDLIEDHEASVRRLREDRRGLDHLDHEGRSPAREVVARPDAAEQSVDKAKSRGRGGPERPRLREDDDPRILAQKGARKSVVWGKSG